MSSFWDTAQYEGGVHPLFSDRLPSNNDPTIQALAALAEIDLKSSSHWKSVGNDHFAESKQFPARLKDAIDAYTQGIEICSDDKVLKSSLYCNRALCHLKRGDLTLCVKDVDEALKFDPNNLKAYHHGAKALLGLELYERAAQLCAKCPKSEAAIQNLAERAEAHLNLVRGSCNDRVEELVSWLKEHKGIIYKDAAEFGGAALDRPRIREDGTVIWSVLLLIEEFEIAEMAQAVEDSASLDDLLDTMFAQQPPWDHAGQYRPRDLKVLLNEKSCDKSLPLSEILAGFEVNKFPVFTILRKEDEKERRKDEKEN